MVAPRRRARRVARWLGYGVGGVALAAGALLLLGLALLRTDWGRERVRRELEHRLAAVVRGHIAIGRVEGDVLGRPTLRDRRDHRRARRRADPDRRRDARLDLWPLLRGDLRLHDVVVSGARWRCAATPPAESTWGAVPAQAGRATRPAPRLSVDGLRLEEGVVLLADDGGRSATVDGLVLAATLTTRDGVTTLDVRRRRAAGARDGARADRAGDRPLRRAADHGDRRRRAAGREPARGGRVHGHGARWRRTASSSRSRRPTSRASRRSARRLAR